VRAHKFSKSAQEKITGAGGKAEVIEIKVAPVANRRQEARAQRRAQKVK
jgi:ribosomal protein L18E